MSNQFERVPTCGENDVDLRVATKPRRVTDAVLSQIIATKDGEIAALTAEVAHLAEKLAGMQSVDRNAEPIAEVCESFVSMLRKQPDGERWPVGTKLYVGPAAPQPVDAAQAAPEGWKLVPIEPAAYMKMGWAYLDAARATEPFTDWAFSHAGYRAMIAAAPVPPTDTTKGA